MADQFVPADQPASLLGSGVDPGNEALLNALTQIRALQSQPLISTDPFAQLGSGLQGLAAGFRGTENPAVMQALAVRAQQQRGLGEQLGLGINLSHLSLQQQDQLLRQEREKRADAMAAFSEQHKNALELFKTRASVVQGMLGLAKDNPLYATPALREMESMYKDANIPLPPGGFTVDGMSDLLKQGKRIGFMIQQTRATDADIANATGVKPQDVATMRTTLATPGPKKDALMKELFGYTEADLEKDRIGAEKAKVDLSKSKLDAAVTTRLFQLEQMPTRTPAQEVERMTLQNFGKAPSDERDMAAAIMRREGLPLDLAIPKAARILAEAKRNITDFDQVVNAMMAANPQMSRGEAVLAANAQTKASKADFTQIETSIDTMKDFTTRLRQVSSQVNLGASGLTQVPRAMIRYGTSVVRADVALASLQRKQGELADVMRFLGEKGVISDRDIVRGQLLIPSMWTSGPVAEDSIRELEGIIKTAERNLARRKSAATTISGPSQPAAPAPASNDPLGIR